MTADDMSRSRLGRGLAALLGDIEGEFREAAEPHGLKRVPIEFLRRNPRNPRIHFAEPELDELAVSIRERGILQPILVRPVATVPDAYEIIAGERRWRAAQRAGLHEVPVVVVEADDRLALEYAIIENVQRSDLNALEEASGYEHLIDQHGYSQTDLAAVLGKSRSHVANTLRLLRLPEPVREQLRRGEISAGHARALLAVQDPVAVGAEVVARGLTVRDVERIGRTEAESAEADPAPQGRKNRRPAADADTRALEAALETSLGLVVRIRHEGQSGEMRIRYSDLDQLDALCSRLKSA